MRVYARMNRRSLYIWLVFTAGTTDPLPGSLASADTGTAVAERRKGFACLGSRTAAAYASRVQMCCETCYASEGDRAGCQGVGWKLQMRMRQ